MRKKCTSAIALMLSALVLSLSACNTTAGIGRDIESTGNALENAAEDSRPGNN
jgi:predicted small secreted protein